MPSSHRIIKATHAYKGESVLPIDTLFEQLEEELESQMEASSSPTDAKLKEARQKSHALIEKAEAESEQLMAAAREEAETIRQQAQSEGFQSGQQEGLEAGYAAGYQEGTEKALEESAHLKEQAYQLIQQAHEEIHRYQMEKKSELLELAVHMAEKIVHLQIDAADEGVLKAAEPYLYQLEKDEELVTLTVHPDSFEQVKAHLDRVKAISPETRFLVVADPKLEERGLIIESSRAVVDLQIKKQLDAMISEMKEMERTV